LTSKEVLLPTRGLYVIEVARRAGVNPQTLLFYERMGLIAQAPRTRSGYRLFEPDAVSAIRFIQRAQHLGLTLKRAVRLGACLALATALWAGSVGAQGMWFDIGSGQPVTVFCPTDSASWMQFPPYAFGEFWPPGTLVYAALIKEQQEGFAAVYHVMFSDGGCGCGGLLYKPVNHRFHYDETALLWPEDETTLYELSASGWLKLEGASLDTEADVLSRSSLDLIVGTTTYGIGPGEVTSPVRRLSWGRIKALYR